MGWRRERDSTIAIAATAIALVVLAVLPPIESYFERRTGISDLTLVSTEHGVGIRDWDLGFANTEPRTRIESQIESQNPESVSPSTSYCGDRTFSTARGMSVLSCGFPACSHAPLMTAAVAAIDRPI